MITIDSPGATRRPEQGTQGMRIAMVDPSLFTLPYDEALCSGLCRAGLDIRLYGRACRTGERAVVNAVELYPSFYHFERRLAGLPRKMFLAGKGLDHIASMRRFLKDVHSFCPAVIHFQWLVLPFVDIQFLKALRRRFPLVLTVHDTDAFNATASSVDMDSLVKLAEQLALDPSMQNRMGRGVATLYSELPSWNEIADQTARLYWRLSQDSAGDRRHV